MTPRFDSQLAFIIEIDKVKAIVRKTKLFDGSRFENDAEHSWSICVMAVLFREYANFPIDLEKVLKMLLIHDVVEIDAGDTYLYAPERATAHLKETEAAERIFGLLPGGQKKEMLSLWHEFEARQSNEAKFAAVFDRLEPLVQNCLTGGASWKEHQITYTMVVEKNRHIRDGSEEIWQFVLGLLDEAVVKGYLPRD